MSDGLNLTVFVMVIRDKHIEDENGVSLFHKDDFNLMVIRLDFEQKQTPAQLHAKIITVAATLFDCDFHVEIMGVVNSYLAPEEQQNVFQESDGMFQPLSSMLFKSIRPLPEPVLN